MWFNNYGDSFDSEDDAREDANYMMDWQDYEEQILKNDPLFSFFSFMEEDSKNKGGTVELPLVTYIK